MIAVAGRASVLTVRSGRMAGSSDIAVTVEDTGIGIADQDSRRIFEPFFSTKASGSGVGLTICQVIIEAPWRKPAGLRQQALWNDLPCEFAQGRRRVARASGRSH